MPALGAYGYTGDSSVEWEQQRPLERAEPDITLPPTLAWRRRLAS